MSKSRKITLLAAVAVILALFIVAFATGGYANTVDCPDCRDGHSLCEKCKGVGMLTDGENWTDCPECIDGRVSCADCDSFGYIYLESSVEGEGPVMTECASCEASGREICGTCGGAVDVTGSFWALIPPVIAIALALITKEVYSSLFIGIFAGGLLAGSLSDGFSFTGGIDAVVSDGLIEAVSGTAGIFIFLVILGVMVALINKAGGSAAFGRWAKTHIKTRVGAQLATFALGVLIFIDDYFNCLTVGSVMRPVADSHRVSRAKLSYIIDATAAPICMIALISSWAAAVSSYAPEGESGILMFIKAIPYNFYSILTIVFVIAIVLMKFDFGPMKRHEKNAIELGDLYTEGERVTAVEESENSNGKVYDLIVPIVALVAVCVFGLMYVGGILSGAGFIGSFENTDATVGLPWGCIIVLVLTIAYFAVRKLVSFKEAMKCIPKGFIAMVPAILILTFATALKNTTSLLGAKYFVGDLMNSAAEGLASFLPAIIFLVACVLAFATGTSWGTFGILIPIVVSVFPEGSELLIIGMSACLAGAVCGDHCSPISDTTIMSSAGAQCNHLNHVSTQIPYAVTVAAVSFVMFVISGFVQIVWICLPLGIVAMIGTLFAIKYIGKAKEKKAAK